MKYDCIMFDMDGTLVPMDVEEFTKGYFVFLYEKLKKHGISQEDLVKCIWGGTKKMVLNDGSKTNEDVFWETFKVLANRTKEELNADCLDFYSHEFNKAICFTGPNPLAKEAVELAKKKANKVILATNPLFPYPGQLTRMSWVGLKEEDFAYISSYEKERHCKPNPMYFADLLKRFDLDPAKTLMIGNDEFEDAYAASKVGIDTYLVTDCLVKSDKFTYEGKKGTFKDLVSFLESLD